MKKKLSTSKKVPPKKKVKRKFPWREANSDPRPQISRQLTAVDEEADALALDADSFVDAEVTDKYPSPKPNSKIFTNRWKEFLPDVTGRENFKPGHLSQLRVLCDLYVEYEKLTQDINEHGYTYESHGRNGDQWKPRPEVIQLNRTRSEIRSYSKVLGLLLMKDKDLNDPDDDKKEWT